MPTNFQTLSAASLAVVRKSMRASPGWYAFERSYPAEATLRTMAHLSAAERHLRFDTDACLAEWRAQSGKAFASTDRTARKIVTAPRGSGSGVAMAHLVNVLKGYATRQHVADLIEARLAPEVVETVIVERASGERKRVEGIRHYQYANLLRVAACRDANGNRLNVLLVGPAGTGKTTAAIQLAADLGLPFHFQSIAMEPFELTGFISGHGEYHETPFVKAFRDGGVFLADEMDAWNDVALLSLNAANSVGRMTIPTGEQIKRHPDFLCIAGANTYGLGADAEYSARNKLDGSTLSRFGVRIDWAPDQALEVAFSPADRASRDWTAEVQIAREVMLSAGLPKLADARTMESGHALLASGFTVEECRELTYLAPLDQEQRYIVSEGVKAGMITMLQEREAENRAAAERDARLAADAADAADAVALGSED